MAQKAPPPKESDFAREGTIAHSLAEVEARREFKLPGHETYEADLEKGRSLGDKVEKFKEMTTKVNSSIATLKSLSSENINYAKLDEVKSKLTRLEALTNNMVVAVDKSVKANNGSAIAAAFLNINDT